MFDIDFPPAVPPVKDIILTSLCDIKGSPVLLPKPVTTFKTPGGKSASSKTSINSRVEQLDCSDGFKTTVFPAAMHGANFQINVPIGEFQGRICATTPYGSHFM